MKNKKETKKRRPENASLIKKYNPRVRQEFIDQDYLEKLNPEETAWLAKFMSEWNGASFNRDGSDIDQSDEGRKQSYERNNKRNNDMYGILKNKADKFGTNRRLVNYDNIITEVEQEFAKGMAGNTIENAYLDYIEYKEIEEMLLEYDMAMNAYQAPLLEVLEEAKYSAEDGDGTASDLEQGL